jgi:CelD/BcsL family acetyltransferase involved in cellulose biosynthesis
MDAPSLDNVPLVDAHSLTDLPRVESHWRGLAARALEPNPFAESAFLIPAAKTIAPRRLTALCVWESPKRTRLNGLAILRSRLAPFGLVGVWRSEQAPLPALLLDCERADVALEAIADWLASHWPWAVGLGVAAVDVDGGLAEALRTTAARRSLRLDGSNPRLRAALPCGSGANFAALLGAQRRKEWGRTRRRLEELGKLEFAWSDCRSAIEDFLALEASGWKRERGTALLADAHRAAFARAMLDGFASDGRLRIARLSLDGRLIASGAVLRAGDRAFYWKTAFDPTFAEFSPGVQLTLSMSRALETDPGLALADSCAEPNHTMIDRIWPARIALADYALATRAGASLSFPLAIAARRAKAYARGRVKWLIGRRRGPRR